MEWLPKCRKGDYPGAARVAICKKLEWLHRSLSGYPGSVEVATHLLLTTYITAFIMATMHVSQANQILKMGIS